MELVFARTNKHRLAISLTTEEVRCLYVASNSFMRSRMLFNSISSFARCSISTLLIRNGIFPAYLVSSMVSKSFLHLYYRHCPFAKASKTKFIAQKDAYHSTMVRPKPLSHLPSSFSQPDKFSLQAFHAFRTPSLIYTILSISGFSATQIFPASHARQIAMPRNTKHPKGRCTAPSSPPPNPSDRNDTSTIYFYTPTSHPYAFLCQMYPCSFTSPQKHPGVIFTSAEQYMMYCKALVFSRPDVAKSILKLECPPEQKYLARGIKPSTAEHKEW